MQKRVVITGAGILASNGKGKEEYWQALEQGEVGYKPVTLFDASEFLVNQAGEISDFDAKKYMGQKGLRCLDRSTKLWYPRLNLPSKIVTLQLLKKIRMRWEFL